jgi:hypothetical protein
VPLHPTTASTENPMRKISRERIKTVDLIYFIKDY